MASLSGAIDDLIEFTNKLNLIIAKFEQGRAIVDEIINGRDLDKSWKNRVVTVFDAAQVLEDFRLGALKRTVQEQFGIIKSILDAILHPNRDIIANNPDLPPAARIGLTITGFVQSAFLFMDRVLEIEDALLVVLRLFNFVNNEEDKILAAALTQSNPRVSIDFSGRLSKRMP